MAKILLVDDDLFIRELYQEILTKAGHEVDTAEDGLKGFDKIQKGEYDLVLLDVMMPHLDGIGILRKLSEVPRVKKCPIMLLTNLAYDPIIQEAMERGAVACLDKSGLDPDELLKKIEEVLKTN